jgi:hypothetical protein
MNAVAVVASVHVEAPMTETLTIPAHIEDGSLRLDAPLPNEVESIEVRVTVRAPRRSRISSLIRYLESLPPGTRTREDIDAEIREGRGDENR